MFKITLAFLFLPVIGRGGEQINKLQSETGAKIQVAPGKLWGIFKIKLFCKETKSVSCNLLYFVRDVLIII